MSLRDERAFRRATGIFWVSAAAVILTIVLIPLGLDRFWWSIPASYLRSFNWTVVQSLVLAWTLIAVLCYALLTWRIAHLQKQELGLRKQPVVSFYGLMIKRWWFVRCIVMLFFMISKLLLKEVEPAARTVDGLVAGSGPQS